MLIGIVLLIFLPSWQVIYALASRTVEFRFVIIDDESRKPIPAAIIEIWEVPVGQERKKVTHVVTGQCGIARYVRENMMVEDVTGINPGKKLEGVRRHPRGIGTFVDRYWCNLDITAKGFIPMQHVWLSDYEYEDQGFIKEGNYHRTYIPR